MEYFFNKTIIHIRNRFTHRITPLHNPEVRKR